MADGTVVFLNGTSGAGKSTLARTLQQILPEPYLHLSLDYFDPMFPPRYHAVVAPGEAERASPEARAGLLLVAGERDGAFHFEARQGPISRRFMAGVHRCIRALATTGNNVIVDHLLLRDVAREECARALAGLPALLVGVHCPLDVARRRQRERGDRLVDLAAWQAGRVHAGIVYDLEIDTTRSNPAECARLVAAALASSPARRTDAEWRRVLGLAGDTPAGAASGAAQRRGKGPR
ncbi:MAG TPA: AAA family ATPase [Thermomicrobiales bacterium]|nr:AAA family ATPase [Thermomicrobiales bacterium]